VTAVPSKERIRSMNTKLPPAGAIGAEITDFDLRRTTPDDARRIKDLVYAHKLVVLRSQTLSIGEYVEFGRKLGRPQVYFQPNYHHPEHPEVFVSGNVKDEKGRKVGVSGTGRYWHTDYQFFAQPLPFVMVYPQILPSTGRGTEFIDLERVYARLPETLRARVDGRRAIQEGKWRYKITPADVDKAIVDILAAVEAMVPALKHPAVIEHPLTGAKSLYVSSGFTTGIEGLSIEEGRAVLAEIFAFVEREEHVHTHTYAPGDILLWENRRMIHKAVASPPGEPSLSYRIGVYDGLPFYKGCPCDDGEVAR
jgi:taurine dioxygenase